MNQNQIESPSALSMKLFEARVQCDDSLGQILKKAIHENIESNPSALLDAIKTAIGAIDED